MKRIVDAGEDDKTIHVLVAEDDSFQRLALIDILTLCNYEVTAVENGRLARDELLKENSFFDVVLLDLMMPEMHGLELLCLMKANDKLKDIPVIMMSSDGERDIVSMCIQKGAKDYLVKPLRISMVKGIAKHVSANNQGKQNSSEKVQYKKLNVLGQGAAGSVELVQRTDNGQLYALKVIPLHFMSQQEKKLAESEVTLLKVLVAPTIIRYYDSFMENDSICIVMEYAKNGSLFDLIHNNKVAGTRIPDEDILYFVTQLIIAVMFMHSKNILHRDIKTQNMFLTSETIVKLGDFGIAKALGTNADMTKTLVGTPYFMSPEVCKGEQYGNKADIWAIGCTLYELAKLRRPFQYDNINILFDKIQNEDPDPIDDECSEDIKMLVTSLLNKDPASRPSVWELAQMPCIFKNIEKYQKEEAPEDDYLMGIIMQNQNSKKNAVTETQIEEEKSDFNKRNQANNNKQTSNSDSQQRRNQNGGDGNNNSNGNQNQDSNNKDKSNQETVNRPVDKDRQKIFQMVKSLRQGVQLTGVKTGIASYEVKLVKGEEIKNWFKDHYPGSVGDVTKYIEDMIERQYLHVIIKDSQIKNTYYRFQGDIPGIPQNMVYIIDDKGRDPFEIQGDLIELANQILKEVSDNYNIGQIINEKLQATKKFTKFEDIVCELQLIKLDSLSQEDMLPFFLNLQQIMYLHQYLKKKLNKNALSDDPYTYLGLLGKIVSYIPFMAQKQNPDVGSFLYKIQDCKFSLDDIKHGILRNNKKPQFQSQFKGFSKGDSKLKYAQELDQRVLFLFREENAQPKLLVFFTKQTLEEQLDKVCKNILNSHVCFDSIDNDLTIHKIFQMYTNDFNKDPKQYLDIIFKYVKNLGNQDEILDGIKENSIFIQYEENFE